MKGIMNHTEIAAQLFNEGYNCAQAVAGAYAGKFGLNRDDVFKMTAGFGGGMSGMRAQCGTVSAMVFIAGVAFGSYNPKDNTRKKELYDIVKKMIAEFNETFGTTNCRELLVKASILPLPDPSERTPEYYNIRPCIRFVIEASEIIQRNLKK
jgi:C_GCAxxG_C_C family probable redox protein